MSTMDRAQSHGLGCGILLTVARAPAPARPWPAAPQRRRTPTSSARTGPSAACSAISTTRSCSAASRSTSEVCSRCHGVAYRLPQSGAAGRTGLPRGRRQVAGRHLPGRRRTQRTGQDRQASGLLADHMPSALQERAGGPLRPERRAAARPVADHQGARRRGGHAVLPRADLMLRDIATATRKAAPTTSTPTDRLQGAADRHEDGRLHELQQSLPRPPDRHAQSVSRRRRPREVRRRHAGDGRQLRPRRDGLPGLGRRSAARGAQAHGPAGDGLPAHHRPAARPRQAPHLARACTESCLPVGRGEVRTPARCRGPRSPSRADDVPVTSPTRRPSAARTCC